MKKYIHVIEKNNSTFRDVKNSYIRLSNNDNTIEVIDTSEFIYDQNNKTERYESTDSYYILWHDMNGVNKDNRNSKIFIHYSEMIGEELTYQPQFELYNKFIKNLNNYDLVLVHTPYAEKILKNVIEKVHYCPIGYDELVYGKPDFKATKTYDINFVGSMVGRRKVILDNIKKTYKDRLITKASWGNDRHNRLNSSRINLIIPWSLKSSFTSMRLWQTIGSSSVMAVECVDAYPALPGKHYIQLPSFTDDFNKAMWILRDALRSDLISMATQAYEDLSTITTKTSMDAIKDLVNLYNL